MEVMVKVERILLYNENTWALTHPPATCPLCQYSCPNVIKWCQDIMLWRHVTPWRHAVTSHNVLCHNKKALSNLHRTHHKNVLKSRFLKWRPWPMTLTFKLVRDFVKVNISTKFCVRNSNGTAVRVLTNWRTHTHTDTRDRFYTLDRWRGREWHTANFCIN